MGCGGKLGEKVKGWRKNKKTQLTDKYGDHQREGLGAERREHGGAEGGTPTGGPIGVAGTPSTVHRCCVLELYT